MFVVTKREFSDFLTFDRCLKKDPLKKHEDLRDKLTLSDTSTRNEAKAFHFIARVLKSLTSDLSRCTAHVENTDG